MPLPTFTNLGAALLAGYRASAAPPPAAPEPGDRPADDVLVLCLRIKTATGGAEQASAELRALALAGLESMHIRHPERLRKLAADALRSETYTFRAVGVLAEYARTRRT